LKVEGYFDTLIVLINNCALSPAHINMYTYECITVCVYLCMCVCCISVGCWLWRRLAVIGHFVCPPYTR